MPIACACVALFLYILRNDDVQKICCFSLTVLLCPEKDAGEHQQPFGAGDEIRQVPAGPEVDAQDAAQGQGYVFLARALYDTTTTTASRRRRIMRRDSFFYV